MTQIKPELIRIAARQVRVWRGGDGPQLLLLHGGMGDAPWYWRTVWETLAESFHVVAPDLPRFGGTVELPNASWMEFLAWLARVQELLNLSKVVVAGNAFGASFARLYAAANPTRVSRLVLVDGGRLVAWPKLARRAARASWSAPFFELARRQLFSEKGIRRVFANPALATPDVVRASQAVSYGFRALSRQVIFSELPTQKIPSQPTQLIWGERDKLAPLSRAREIAADIPDAQLAVIARVGHMPQCEDPVSFVRILRAFCGQ
ncbi:alpha/beta fold hydrolase [Anaerolineae bacterium CFX7]|nr:alpha/beta fold hydrolase [Anaerolineae bacterium CFX7]